nr:hypothetical protein [Tanacetum cinerariifolium]
MDDSIVGRMIKVYWGRDLRPKSVERASILYQPDGVRSQRHNIVPIRELNGVLIALVDRASLSRLSPDAVSKISTMPLDRLASSQGIVMPSLAIVWLFFFDFAVELQSRLFLPKMRASHVCFL